MNTIRVVRLTAFTLSALGIGTASAADFDCLPFAPSASKSPAYRKHGEAPICEGFYERDVSAPFLELLSLLTSRDISTTDVGEVVLASQAATHTAAILHIQPLTVGKLYRVDALLTNDRVVWNSTSLGNATGVNVTELGFLATAGQSKQSGLLVVPVGDAKAAHPTTFFATFRVSETTKSVLWRAYPAFDKSNRRLDWHEALTEKVYQWESFELAITADASGVSLALELKATGDDGTRFQPLRALIIGNDYVGERP